MAQSKSGGGGGYGSRQHVETSVRTGMRARQMRQAGVSQIGEAVGSHATNKADTGYRGDPVHGSFRPSGSPGGVKLGNEVAAATKAGPGGSREILKSGSQGLQGAVAGSVQPKGRDILGAFGPEISK
jgi:hypothetical protein